MKKVILIATAVLFCAGVGLGIAVAKDAPGGVINVSSPGAKKEPVPFDHAKHKDMKCDQCHHKGLDDPKCSTCHTVEGKDGVSKLQDAMHGKDKGACRSCHFDDGAKKLKCADCHKK